MLSNEPKIKWSSYVAPNPQVRGSKTQSRFFSV